MRVQKEEHLRDLSPQAFSKQLDKLKNCVPNPQ